MASVTGFTAERMLEIEAASIIQGTVEGDDLILTRRDQTEINAGYVRGPQGVPGPPGGLGEAPSDGKGYVRLSGAWVLAPGSLLGRRYNPEITQNTLSTPVSFGDGGTLLTVPVSARGVTVEFGAKYSHTLANRQMYVVLYVDGVLWAGGEAAGQNGAANGVCDLGKTVTFVAGELSVANHTFELKARQSLASSAMNIYESHISIRAN